MTGGFRRGRTENTRSYKRLFLIVAEGAKTEKSYFERNLSHLINKEIVHIFFVKKPTHASSPRHVKSAIDAEIKKRKGDLIRGDEAWIVIDRDLWTESDINDVYQWTQDNTNTKLHCDLALSNPCFEYWLLLHFEDGDGVSTVSECQKQLEEYIKLVKGTNMPEKTIKREHVEKAIPRAKKANENKWGPTQQPITTGHIGTTVYRLVEKLLEL